MLCNICGFLLFSLSLSLFLFLFLFLFLSHNQLIVSSEKMRNIFGFADDVLKYLKRQKIILM